MKRDWVELKKLKRGAMMDVAMLARKTLAEGGNEIANTSSACGVETLMLVSKP
jgi:hypothetical protein